MPVCSEPGCPKLTDRGRCKDCETKARRASDAKRQPYRQHYSNREWRRTRDAYKRMHPICEDPEGCIAPATDVHHLDGKGFQGPRGHDFDNLEALCHSHHARRTAKEQPGGWNLRPVPPG